MRIDVSEEALFFVSAFLLSGNNSTIQQKQMRAKFTKKRGYEAYNYSDNSETCSKRGCLQLLR